MLKTETYYCWRELATVRGESEPRLLVPWSDPSQYEYSADGLFDTPEQAREWRDEIAKDIDEDASHWVLCRLTTAPVGDLDAHPEQESIDRDLAATMLSIMGSLDSDQSPVDAALEYKQSGILDGADAHAVGFFEGVAAAWGKDLRDVLALAAELTPKIR